jgi:MYXO-CTERM domain-containing protein
VECLTDSNCGKQGIKCMDGVCGSCGDGICSDKERNGMFGPCNDCFAGCPKTDLHSKTGDNAISGTLSSTDGQFTTSCGAPVGPGATYSWTAPDSGSYTFTVTGGANLSIYDTNCAGQPLSCNSYFAGLYLNKGQTVALIANGSTAGSKFSVAISTSMVSMCNPVFCPMGPSGESTCCLGDMSCGLIDQMMGCVPPSFVTPGTGGTTGFPMGTSGFGPGNAPGNLDPGFSSGTGNAPGNGTGGSSTSGKRPSETGGGTSTLPDGGGNDTPAKASTSGGCGCAVPRDGASSKGALTSLALAALLAFARRRREAAASR